MSSDAITAALVRRLRISDAISDDDIEIIRALPVTVKDYPAERPVVRDGQRATECCLIIEGFCIRSKTLSDGKRQILSHPYSRRNPRSDEPVPACDGPRSVDADAMQARPHQPRGPAPAASPQTERRRDVLARHADRRRHVPGMDRQCRAASGAGAAGACDDGAARTVAGDRPCRRQQLRDAADPGRDRRGARDHRRARQPRDPAAARRGHRRAAARSGDRARRGQVSGNWPTSTIVTCTSRRRSDKCVKPMQGRTQGRRRPRLAARTERLSGPCDMRASRPRIRNGAISVAQGSRTGARGPPSV